MNFMSIFIKRKRANGLQRSAQLPCSSMYVGVQAKLVAVPDTLCFEWEQMHNSLDFAYVIPIPVASAFPQAQYHVPTSYLSQVSLNVDFCHV